MSQAEKWFVLISSGWALTTEPLLIKSTKLELGSCKAHASCDIRISNLLSVGSSNQLLTEFTSCLSSPSALLHGRLPLPTPHPTPHTLRSISPSVAMTASPRFFKNPTSFSLCSCALPLPTSEGDVCLPQYHSVEHRGTVSALLMYGEHMVFNAFAKQTEC